ncbi:uncharacterized protein LOC100200147 isoform X3 [Hydra vulgaris]|uniref:Uncharacterized protein LOC100200147 isoform X8 n=1 Tax=Hydra vulgaris TaxID=6087 RepID=A0ABM4DB80_HYDVU|nr:uncharacterized RNA-binding protein C660.15 isoform X4 [Hydra vulgaris]
MAGLQQIAPIPNNSIPVMGSIPTVVYQQQPGVVLAGQQFQYTPKKPFAPRERNPNEEQCKIFVGAVGRNTTEESLRAYFGKFGEISDSVIMCNKQTGEPRGFAFVTFKYPDAVQAVIDQCSNGGHTLDGKTPLQVRKYFPKAEYDAEKAAVAASNGVGANGSNSQFQYKGPMKVNPELKVFVGGIGIGTTEDDVRKYFSTFGKVVQVDMPYHHIYKCPKGFAFVGFENSESVHAVTQDRYHQINGKTVEVKGADEQAQHFNKRREAMSSFGRGRGIGVQQQTAIGTVSGFGAFSLPQQQVLVPQNIGGITQYTAVQMPQTQTAGGYVFDPSTNTYYQIPATPIITAGGTLVSQQFAQPGITYLSTGAQFQRPGTITADMLSSLTSGQVAAIGGVYSSETSQFGPARSHILAGTHQPMAGNAVDPHVVYSSSTSISAGDVAAISSQRGYHPYGR